MRVRYIYAYTHTHIRAFFATRYSACVDDEASICAHTKEIVLVVLLKTPFYILNPKSHIPYPSPHNPHPTPHTPHPTSYALHPKLHIQQLVLHTCLPPPSSNSTPKP